LYKRARSGEIRNFTGIGSPFEEPINAKCTLETGKMSVEDCVELLIKELN
jgi:adenylylsulfate kinase-like enzyme